jgi:hypothetical protein
VLYGDAAHIEVVSRPGRGTRVVMEMPRTASFVPEPYLERASISS